MEILYDVYPGAQIGLWTVIRKDPLKNNYWICRCKCGIERSIYVSSLRHGKSQSCGRFSLHPDFKRSLSFDLKGKKIKDLKVLKSAGTNYRNEHLWACKTEEGTIRFLPTFRLLEMINEKQG